MTKCVGVLNATHRYYIGSYVLIWSSTLKNLIHSNHEQLPKLMEVNQLMSILRVINMELHYDEIRCNFSISSRLEMAVKGIRGAITEASRRCKHSSET